MSDGCESLTGGIYTVNTRQHMEGADGVSTRSLTCGMVAREGGGGWGTEVDSRVGGVWDPRGRAPPSPRGIRI